MAKILRQKILQMFGKLKFVLKLLHFLVLDLAK